MTDADARQEAVMETTIRPMRESDSLEQIAEWFEAIGREWLLDHEAAPRGRAEMRTKLEQWLRGADGRSCILLAETREPKVVGFAVCLLQTDPDSNELFGRINGLYVEPEHRGEHAGRKLKEAADDWCRQAGAKFMKAYIRIGNHDLLRICKLLGYQPSMITMVRRFD